jgi:putative FmdB family regulatory protein
MPLYEYKCHRCNKKFEVRQKFADEPLTVHEDCGGEAERLISVPSLQFKGTGWYVTDYGKGGKLPSANGSNEKSDSNGKSESNGKSDSKSDSAKTESSKSESSKTESAKSESSKGESSKSESSKTESKSDSKPAST